MFVQKLDMKVIVIGSGNVATVLGKKILKAGHDILQVISRNDKHAANLAKKLKCGYTSSLLPVNNDAGLYIAAISDTALTELSNSFFLDNKLIIHTAGSVSKDVLKNISKNYGVIYPLQSLRKEITEVPQIPLLVDGNTEDNLTLIYDFAKTISADVYIADDATRLKLHVAAIIVNNFTNHLYALAQDFCDKENVDFKLLLPLIEETSHRLLHFPAAKIQTGPAIRNDQATIANHLKQLENYPGIKLLYQQFTENIQQFHKINTAD
jgi:predicted short-subunit dehydrogenase-like oxidoreductase (DUF2520 family)